MLLQFTIAGALCVVQLSCIRRAGRALRRLIKATLPGSDDQVIWAFEATGRRLNRVSTCLVRALASEMRLSSDVRRLHLVIGVARTTDGMVRSHAWLRDRDQVLVGGPVDATLLPLVTWESLA